VTDIAFYHLQKSPLEAVLPRLLLRTLEAGKRALVLARSAERVESLSSALWTFDPAAWLPHGSDKDGRPAEQPVWLSERPDNPNGAQFVFLTDGAELADLAPFERCFDLFDGNDPAALEAARERWKRLKDSGHVPTYWQQNERGQWEKKAG
jgi:DNA polymerase III subunit chi